MFIFNLPPSAEDGEDESDDMYDEKLGKNRKAIMQTSSPSLRRNQSASNVAKSIINHLSEKERILLEELQKTRENMTYAAEVNENYKESKPTKRQKKNNNEIIIDLDLDSELNRNFSPFRMPLPSNMNIINNNIPSPSIMPIFRLPSVSPTAKVVRTIPTIENKRNEELLRAKEEEIRLGMQKKLGLSDSDYQQLHNDTIMKQNNGKGYNSIELALNLPINNNNNSKKRKAPGDDKKRSPKKSSNQYGIRQTPRVLRAGKWSANDIDALSLRQELGISLECVQTYTEKVQVGISQIRSMCPITSLRAQLYMKKWGLEKFENILKKIFQGRLINALEVWRANVKMLIYEEKRVNFQRYSGAAKLIAFLQKKKLKLVHSGYVSWLNFVKSIKGVELHKYKIKCATKIQSVYRSHLARIRVYKLKMKIKFERENYAAILIQARWRGYYARNNVAKILKKIKQNNAATKIQAIARGRIKRNWYKNVKEEEQKRKAAIKIQAVQRGKLGRRKAALEKDVQEKTKSAIKIQAIQRGKIERNKLAKQRLKKKRYDAAVSIQRRFRGRASRKLYKEIRRLAMIQRQKEERAALKLQATYRMHRGRLAYHLKNQARVAAKKYEKEAAIKLQRVYRGRLGRRRVKGYKKEMKKQHMDIAKKWAEYWDSDANRYFYYHQENEEAVWEPPSTGYIKADGMLVLQTGEVVEDVPDPPDPNEFPKCIECKTADAIRKCHQCEDNYCVDCYIKTHSTGKRLNHTYQPVGLIRCVECVNLTATKWCKECDDPFCDKCFATIHKRGKKQRHTWTKPGNMGEGSEYGPDDFTNDGGYVSGGTLATDISGYDSEFTTKSNYGYATEVSGYESSATTSTKLKRNSIAPVNQSLTNSNNKSISANKTFTTSIQDNASDYGSVSYNNNGTDNLWYDSDRNSEGAYSTDQYNNQTYASDAENGYASDYAGYSNQPGYYENSAITSEWTQYTDESSGYPYWYNHSTGITTWDNPNS